MVSQANVLIVLSPSNNPGGRLGRTLAERFPDLNINTAGHHSEAGPYIKDAQVLLTFGALITDDTLRNAKALKWIHVLGSGLDGVIGRPTLRDDVIVTNSRGLQAGPVSEAALALMFALARDVPKLVRHQAAQKWQRFAPVLLGGKTVCIVGVGAIAEVLAQKCAALGLRVTGVSASRASAPGFAHIYKRSDLTKAATESDFLVVLAPAAQGTMGLINAEVLAAMRPTSYLVNAGRGGVVDEPALIAALEQGAIAGAALDVTATEPLPQGHKLWSLPNVLISPHLGGFHAQVIEALLPLLENNMRLFLNGEPARMANLISHSTKGAA